jgi:hypothetical protein
MKSRRFSQSFRRIFDELKPGEPCKLKHHYRGALREVIGLLDLWAANDPERFVELYGGVDAIVARCHRYKRPEDKFSKPMVEKVLKELRSRHIISKRLERLRDGEEVEGFIVAPHDCLAVRESPTKCVFKGQLKAPGRWKRDPVLGDKGEWTGKLGPVYWAGYAKGTARCTVESMVQSTVNCMVGTSPQPKENETVNRKNSALTESTVVAVSVVLPEKETTPDHTSQVEIEKGKSNGNGKTGGKGKSGGAYDTTDQKQQQPRVVETIEMHFGTDGVDMAEITDGLFKETIESKRLDRKVQESLLTFCDEIIIDWSPRPYLGRKTHGDIMAEAMGRFTAKRGEEVPKYWYPIVRQLRESPAEQRFVEPIDETAELRALFDEHPQCPDCGYRHPGKRCGKRKG